MLDRSLFTAALLSICIAAHTPAAERQAGSVEPLLVAAAYAGPGAKPPRTALADPEILRRDLGRIRQAGYNAILTWITWEQVEPLKGTFLLEGTTHLVAAAAAQELPVVVRIVTSTAPAWAQAEPGSADRFVEGVQTRLSSLRGVVAVEREASGPAVIDLLPAASGLARNRLAFWTAVARGSKRVSLTDPAGGAGLDLLAFGETAGVVTRNQALFAPLQSRPHGVRQVSAAGASVEVRLLESRDVIMIIALNRSALPRTARITFDPDIPEAIWQNLETGATVNFVMTKDGPVLEHTFAAHDAVLLMTGRKLR